jgi:hypothetical protein
MRRRRHQLQVSTFPFLAVLLCAMGSLILLLLVIDRRAKVVLRAKAMEAIRQMDAEAEKETANRAAEWERRRQALHAHLQREKQNLETQTARIEEKTAAAVHDLETEQAQGSQLDRQLQTEQATLIEEQRAIASKFQETAQKKQESEATRAELARLTAELVKLEQTVADLKSLRQKQQRTYSLVPYRGRRGDNRWPIYVECTASSLIFHPDRWTLPATDSGGSAILAEVDRRIRRQQSANGDATEKQTPYLLLLVRPDGIMTYYRTLQSLRGLQIDFGYEFVEPDWVLSFPENESAAGTQPWIATDSSGDDSPSRRRRRSTRSPGGPMASGASNGPGDGASGASDRPGDPGSKGSDQPNDRRSLSGLFRKPGDGTSLDAHNGILEGPGNGGMIGRGEPRNGGIGALPADSAGDKSIRPWRPSAPHDGASPGQLPPGGLGVIPETAGTGGASFGSRSGPSGMSHPTGLGAESPIIGGGSFSQDRGRSRETSEQAEAVRSLATSATSRGTTSGTTSATDSRGASKSDVPGSPFAKNDPGSRAQSSGDLDPVPGRSASANGGNSNSIAQPTATHAPSVPSLIPNVGATPPESSGRPGQKQGTPGNEPDSDEREPQLPGSSDLSQLGSAQDKKSRPAPPVHRFVKRDWNIFVECSADQVVIYPGESKIPTSSLGGAKGTLPLLRAIEQMIARRQAMMASADAPKDAGSLQIRFLVRPDGLRTYFLAYPELASLHVPMTRENLDANEDVTHHMIGR